MQEFTSFRPYRQDSPSVPPTTMQEFTSESFGSYRQDSPSVIPTTTTTMQEFTSFGPYGQDSPSVLPPMQEFTSFGPYGQDSPSVQPPMQEFTSFGPYGQESPSVLPPMQEFTSFGPYRQDSPSVLPPRTMQEFPSFGSYRQDSPALPPTSMQEFTSSGPYWQDSPSVLPQAQNFRDEGFPDAHLIEGRDFMISGGTFNQYHYTISQAACTCVDKLAQKASPLAFHLADSDLSHSTCFTNTRTKILKRIKGWALRNIEKDKFVMWLCGPAGGGKTVIGRTIAKWCEGKGILLGEFFFSRADGTGAQLASLAPTLAYRMAVHTHRDAKEAICNVVNRDPHIFLAPLAIQLKKLVIEPLKLTPSGIVPYIIILDGLDETLSSDDQHLLLNTISETLYQLSPTLRILICCRPEPTIVTAFNDTDSPMNRISTIISLNDDADADADIRAFLVEKFARTKKQLPYPPKGDWPTAENLDYLVKKSSGQFIFAATVERYVCSPKYRHQAVARLKHVLDLRLLPHPKDKKRHPFVVLDALYQLILRTRSDVNMSVHATAVCLEYPKYFIAISPADLSKVLNIELSETWAILYGLASLFDTNEESIRPFHASLGDFLFDSSRSTDFFCNEGDIAADITCAMLRQGRDPEVLSYRAFSRLLRGSTPRQDLRDTLSQMKPVSIFSRPANAYIRRAKGGYYLIPLLRQLENHVSTDAYKNLVKYFDEQFELFLPFGYWRSSKIFIDANSDADNDSILSLQLPFHTLEDDSGYDSEDLKKVRWRKKPNASRSVTYGVYELIPLSTSPAWDEIMASLNICLTGSDSLTSFCDEVHFARSHLKKTLSALLKGSTQAKAAIFCLEQIQSEDITEDLQIVFAKLLPHSLLHAEKLPELTLEKAKASLFCLKQIQSEDITEDLQIAFAKLLPHLLHAKSSPKLRNAIQQLETHHLTYRTLPEESRKAILVYVDSESKRQSEALTSKSRTAGQTVLRKLRGWISSLFRRK